MTQNLINASLLPFGVPVYDPAGNALTAVTPSDGELLIGAAANPLVAALLTAGANVTLTPGSGSLTISASGGSGSTITGVVVTRLTASPATHVFNGGMVCAQILFFGTAATSVRFFPQLTGSGAPYPINYISATGGGDGSSFALIFGTASQLGTQFDYVRGSEVIESGIDPYFASVLSPPPDEPVYGNQKSGDSTLTFQSGAIVTVPGGEGQRAIVGLASTDSGSLPFISPDGMVASKRWANPSLPFSTDPAILILTGTGSPGCPAVGAGTGDGATDLRALGAGAGGGTYFHLEGRAGNGRSASAPTAPPQDQDFAGTGTAGSTVSRLTDSALSPSLGSTANTLGKVIITEYIS